MSMMSLVHLRRSGGVVGFAKLVGLAGLFASMLAASAPSEAAELSEGWTSVRALGMGNAYTAVVADGNALFYNPAGLARISGFHWTVFDPRVGANGLDALQAAQKISGANGDLVNTINNLYGTKVWATGGAKTAITAPGFGIAGFANAEAGLGFHNPANSTINVNYFFDYGIALGVALDFIPEILKVGVVAKRVNRTGTTLPVGPATLATLDQETLKEEFKSRGTGYGVDLGAVLTVPGPIKPALAFVWKNAGGMNFTHEEGAHAPPIIQNEMILGASLAIDLPLISIVPSVDYTYFNRTDVQLGNKVHVGVELDLPLIDLRAGLNQGYYTAGVGLGLGPLDIDIATYGVELGEYPGQQEDRRYVAQLTFQLGFDPSLFGIGGSGKGGSGGGSGSGRHLKQRR
jgi:hypothetical protein